MIDSNSLERDAGGKAVARASEKEVVDLEIRKGPV
jgi:hypothetical protein